ncbi:MAG: class I SAM-dependent methyltransferase [Rhodospirillaceae bacterium]|jgi:ubiquinone/menaquinone biosynthesis C-methylase UbiE|nr:class I SAM-dependent methyltransferase [Rhodospirillaceae bacterium]MBT3926445.1 class I SAM-dependent methyltransferase [Rhodospirillaceae bacterium]MBT4428184.1 class I SAM-dependent methyltransferase [Rhodospirillaceae bacterium]MBT5040301.1 class I SAM-dependent methyltransferase [Rhodospirillaceae bacterium]MBT5674383.1 class I SAM-dependent methyltransferase [Rhodospirillaceae bacterium]
MNSADISEATRQFWNMWPCDGQSSYERRAKLRYTKEPFILHHLRQVTAAHNHIVEVGCGQGTDALTACQYLESGATYTGIDASDQSIASARKAAEERAAHLNIQPDFQEGDALALPFADDSLDCVYSMGVLHHVSDTERAVAEVHRVLKPGSTCYIFLYRTASPKLIVAYMLRAIQAVCDVLSGRQRSLLRVIEKRSFEGALGTMLAEAFGVPVMRSYSGRGIKRLFSRFGQVDMLACGFNWPFDAAYKRANPSGRNAIGNFYYIKATK